MRIQNIALKLALSPNISTVVLMFFAYSFLGYILECIVLTIEKRKLVVNRGFTKHMPLCIIYGFGALLGFALLSPFADIPVVLFILGAVGASVFELFVAWLQIRMFGDFWWDYTEKKMNFRGILCLESTLGWGIVGILVVRYFHVWFAELISRIPSVVVSPLASFLLVAYTVDFIASARDASRKKRELPQEQNAYADEEILK